MGPSAADVPLLAGPSALGAGRARWYHGGSQARGLTERRLVMATGDGTRGQLRRAMVASTIGTSLEWYDFFLYGTAAALVFPHLFFPSASAYAGVLAAFATFAVGFAARPVGAAIFGHYGDRIGRRQHADRDAAADGLRKLRHRPPSDGGGDRRVGRRPARHAPRDPGHRCRRRMGRLGPAGDGVEPLRQARVRRVVAAARASRSGCCCPPGWSRSRCGSRARPSIRGGGVFRSCSRSCWS